MWEETKEGERGEGRTRGGRKDFFFFFLESGGVFETTCSLRHDSDKNDITGNLTVTYDIVTHSAPSLPPSLRLSLQITV